MEIIRQILWKGSRPASIEPGTHTRYHIVKRGETLATIAAAYFGNPLLSQSLLDANRDVLAAPEALVPGQTLRIPRCAGLGA
ncbi:MAG TPA: LysM peptidoglycan-binding domain-containing protein [Steroidobacteraceae bacterium]